MKILIFSESEHADALRDAERAAGNAALVCNPQYFKESEMESGVSKVYTDRGDIAEAYAAKGAEIAPLPAPKKAPKADEPKEAPVEPKPPVLRKFTRKK